MPDFGLTKLVLRAAREAKVTRPAAEAVPTAIAGAATPPAAAVPGAPPASAIAGLLLLTSPTPRLRPLRGPLRPLLTLPCQRLPLPLSSLLRALRRL